MTKEEAAVRQIGAKVRSSCVPPRIGYAQWVSHHVLRVRRRALGASSFSLMRLLAVSGHQPRHARRGRPSAMRTILRVGGESRRQYSNVA